MATQLQSAQDLLDTLGESLSVEVKTWLDLDRPEHQAKLVKAVLALRNFGGGYLVIGFNNKTMNPDLETAPPDVQSTYCIDLIQRIISRYSSELFEVLLEFPTRNGNAYPVIKVPTGVKSPVAARSNLPISGGDGIVMGDVYIRSLHPNNTPSSTKAGWKDWPDIAEICFENREADLGRFLRRHLSGINLDSLRSVFMDGSVAFEEPPTFDQQLQAYLEESSNRLEKGCAERKVRPSELGTWEAALIIQGEVPKFVTNQEFLSLLDTKNPRLTGWPTWHVTQYYNTYEFRPYVNNGCWETFINQQSNDGNVEIDFILHDPRGRFYSRRDLQDDTTTGPNAPAPLTALDFKLAILRTAEAIAVGLTFAKAMGCDPEKTILGFAFRWTRLKGRLLSSWVEPGRMIPPYYRAQQDVCLVTINIPLETALSAISPYVHEVVNQLFMLFNGFSIVNEVVEDLTRQLIERRL